MLLTLTVNGQPYEVDADPRTLLLHLLREDLGLRGTKYGCGEGECGACTVILNGQTVNACLTLAGQAHGAKVVTIEGLAEGEIGAQLVSAFGQVGAVQCGFCIPGFIVSAGSLLEYEAQPSVEAIRQALSGNLCRCTGYVRIIQAVGQAAEQTKPINSRQSGSGGPPIATTRDGHYARPSSLEEALDLLATEQGRWHVVAGGTDLFVQHEHNLWNMNILDIGGLDELRQIQEGEEVVRIGGLVTFSDIIRSSVLQKWAPPLVESAPDVGGVQIQNMATLAGNLVNASPAADGVPPLFVLDATLVLRSTRGERIVPIQEFATGPGQTVLAPDELLTKVIVPKARHSGRQITFFQKAGPRQALTIAKASLAFRGWLDGDTLTHVQVALGAVAPTVIPAPNTATALMQGPFDEATLLAAGKIAARECAPIDDVRSTADHRHRLVRGLLIRNLWPEL